MEPTERSRRRRRLAIAALALLIGLAGLFAALPTVLSGTVARRVLEARAGRILSPGSLEVAAVHLSWYRPTEIDDAVLRDERGVRLIVAPRARLRWNFWQILFNRPETATLELPGADLNIERLADGRLDLYETLRPIIRAEPTHRIVIVIDGGRLRLQDPALAEPVVADRADVTLDLPRKDEPVNWTLSLRQKADDDAGPSGRIEFRGSVNRPGMGGADVSFTATRWPLAVAAAGVVTRGEWDAVLGARRRDARWTLKGDVTATNLAAAGADSPRPADRPPLAPIHASWEIDGNEGVWTSRRLVVATTIRHGSGRSSDAGDRDLPVTLEVDARYTKQSDRLDVGEIELATPYGRLGGSGAIEQVGTAARLDLEGSLEPDWPAIESDLRREIEPNARIAGRSRGWRLAGTLGDPGAADRLAALTGELGIQLDLVDIYGMRLAGTSVVVRGRDGRLRIDPIDGRLNEGILHLEPEWVRGDDGSLRLRFGPTSTLSDAMVNDEVSHRVLSYAAPILDGATRVEGRLSLRRLKAEFPVLGGPARAAQVEGDVLFDDVRFLPGPLAMAIVDLLPRPDGPGNVPVLVLRDPISVRIADRKVSQRGLTLPLADVGTVALEGSVDFDRNLDIVARFGINPPRADRPVLASILKSARFELPIRGTLDEPRVDEQALQERLKSMGSNLLEDSIGIGTQGLLRLLDGLPRRREARKPAAEAGPADPARPPASPAAEERRRLREQRRLERQQKKAERRLQRSGAPD